MRLLFTDCVSEQGCMKKVMYAMKITCVSGALLALMAGSMAQERAKIFTCVDGNGRTLTSDRPIPQCNDRPQRILDGVTGHLQGVRQPSYTQAERDAMEREKAREQARVRAANEKRQYERGLLIRYPNEAAHSAARESAKETLLGVISAAQVRSTQLVEQKNKLDRELEFYGNDIAKAPASLKRQFEHNAREIQEQATFVEGKQAEIERIERHFDAELLELKRLWE